jgi:serine/threonine-protein kinase RsbT
MSRDVIRIAIGLSLPDDIVRARQEGREAARILGFGTGDQTRLATAISEIARNALHYGGGGGCEILGIEELDSNLVVVTVSDRGPGIPDIEKAMTPGFSTGKSLGMGLPGARKLMDSLEITSSPGGTKVVMTMRRRRLG